eukprot:15451888-Alexandrium_andersonii.AAC.1
MSGEGACVYTKRTAEQMHGRMRARVHEAHDRANARMCWHACQHNNSEARDAPSSSFTPSLESKK